MPLKNKERCGVVKRILFVTTYASPYRVHFFDELGKNTELTVLFADRIENQSHRSGEWFVNGEGYFNAVQLKKKVASMQARDLCLDIIDWLKKPWDYIVLCGYSSPTMILAMMYMRLHRIPFYMEVDGGMIRESSGAKYWLKRILVSQASGWISSGKHTTEFLVHYGAREKDTYLYPFTSLWEREIPAQLPSREEKRQLREKLGMTEEKIILYVGRYDPKKGMDDLLCITPELDSKAGVYFVGGEPTQAHLDFCRQNDLSNVHFIGFRRKEALEEYYRASDLLVLPTKSDAWGLVINEAMAQGLPVITTDRCVAGMELVENGINGYIVPVSDNAALTAAINRTLSEDYRKMGQAALEKIRPYTIENMAAVHLEIFK